MAVIDTQTFDFIGSGFDLGPGPNGVVFLAAIAHTIPDARSLIISGNAVPVAAMPRDL